MDPERWGRVRELLAQVTLAAPAEREAALAALCGGDTALAHEVRSLLAVEAEASGFLETPYGVGGGPDSDEAPETLPERIGPYRVVSRLGAGGMGTVYRTRRDDLPRDVAVKVIRAGLDDATLRRRFRHERDILAGLEHPAIARLYDGGATADGRPYLVMELVEGRPLLADAESRGLSAAQRIELFLAVCDAVGYAHGRGVVHRDLKPGNVLVDATGTPKLLDFGIAKLLSPGLEGEPTLTAAPFLTPAYASPEQRRGDPVGPPSDVWSLAALLQRLLDAAGTASRARDRGLRDIVAKASREEPGERYPDAGAFAADLRRWRGGGALAARRGAWRYRGRRLLRRRRGALAAACLAAAAAGTALLVARSGPAATDTAATARSVAVFGFTDLSARPDTSWIGTALVELLRGELAASEELRAIPADQVAQAKIDLRLGAPAELDAERLADLHARVGSDLVVTGSYLGGAQPERPLRLDLQVRRLPGGDVVAELTRTAPAAELIEMVAGAGFELRSRLGLRSLSQAQARQLVALRPADPEAARLFASGVAAWERQDTGEARRLLEAAVTRAPAHAGSHLALARVLWRQGYEQAALDRIGRAAELAKGLPAVERLRIQALAAAWAGDWNTAAAAGRELLRREPRDLDAGLDLALAQLSARQAPQARLTLAALRQLPRPLADDPRLDMFEARLARGTPSGRAAADRAAAKAAALSANLMLARARFAEGAQHWDTPRVELAIPPFEEARRLWEAGGARAEAGGAAIQIGLARWRTGDVRAGEAEIAKLLAEVPRSDLPALRLDALDFLGSMTFGSGQLRRSLELREEAIAVARDLGSEDTALAHEGWRGTLLWLLGDSAAGRRQLTAAHAGLRDLEAEFFVEDAALSLGWVALEGGDLATAEALARAASPAGDGPVHERVWSAGARWLLGAVLAERGRTAAAREELVAAQRLFTGSSMRAEAAEVALCLAAMALEDGGRLDDPSAAVAAAERRAVWSPLATTAAAASTTLPRALLAAGRAADARSALARLEAAAVASGSALHRLQLAIEGARLQAAGGHSAEALGALAAVRSEAERRGYAVTALRARLAAGEIAAAAAPAAARDELRVLARDAAASGFVRLADAAARAARHSGT
jgi:hypothetical protein